MGKVKRREGKAISQANHGQGQLGGKVTIVSGASQGIGQRIALRLGLAGGSGHPLLLLCAEGNA